MKLLGILAALLLTVGAAVALTGSDDGGGGGSFTLGDVRLVSVESCDELVAWFQEAAEAEAVYYATGGGDDMVAVEDAAEGAPTAAPATGSASGAAGGEQAVRDAVVSTTAPAADGDEFSGTNVQERDVDEPDIVKTDGDVLVSVAYDGLRIVDVGDDEPTLLSTLALPQGAAEIILSGDRVLALSTTWREDPSQTSQTTIDGPVGREMIAPAGQPVTVLTSVDISDPSDPQIVETSELPGTYRSARATGDAVRIVVVSSPVIMDPAATDAMTIEQWSPAIEDGDCTSVAHTTEPQGVSTTTVVTLDLQGSLEELDRDSVVADAGTIYASTDRLVIATSRWSQTAQPESGQVSTELHSFDITDPAETSYAGSGQVAGYLLNQFALSEHDGNLRVATTQEPPWDETAQLQATHSGITVLDLSMQEIGRVDGLGATERIQAVRYLGDVAFVVTFRQTDPLYAIDLSDPTAPRVAGELKINGYSAYLHPIDVDRLLGVGQDATDEGQTLGSQVSTFDVSSLSSPQRIDAVRIDGSSSPVEWDHRAFLWWAATRTAVIPIEIYDGRGAEVGVAIDCPPDATCAEPPSPAYQPYTGAVAFDVGEDGSLTERGRVSHQTHVAPNGWWPAIQRSIVVGDALYTLSEAGVLKSDLSSLADEGYVSFPAPDNAGGGVDDKPMPVEPLPAPAPAPAPDDPGTSEPGASGAGTSGSTGAGG
jgi:hypothetical protein